MSLVFLISLQPVKPQFFFGKKFGYVVAFKQHEDYEWKWSTVEDPETRRYVYKDSMTPDTEIQVKVSTYNTKGDGPSSVISVVFSPRLGEILEHFTHILIYNYFILLMCVYFIPGTLVPLVQCIALLYFSIGTFYFSLIWFALNWVKASFDTFNIPLSTDWSSIRCLRPPGHLYRSFGLVVTGLPGAAKLGRRIPGES